MLTEKMALSKTSLWCLPRTLTHTHTQREKLDNRTGNVSTQLRLSVTVLIGPQGAGSGAIVEQTHSEALLPWYIFF